MGARIADWLALATVVAVVYVLVRPQSKAAELVDAIAGFVIALVRGAVDLASAE